jgi:hypothetical protein
VLEKTQPVTVGAHVGRAAFKRRATPFVRRPCLLAPLCAAPFHLPSPRMRGNRRLFASSLEERNSMGVGTFQPSFGFKDFHHTARLLPPLVVTRDGDHQLLGGEEQAGMRSWSHPQLQGCSSSSLGWVPG